MYPPRFTRQVVFEAKEKTTVARDPKKAEHFNFWTRNCFQPQHNRFSVTSLTLYIARHE